MMRLRLLPLLLLPLAVCTLDAQTLTPAFIENNGQWPADVRFQLQLDGLTMWITDRGAVYDLQEVVAPVTEMTNAVPFDRENEEMMMRQSRPLHVRGHLLRAEFVGASSNVEASGVDERDGRYNYFIGNDERKWGRNCRAFASVRLENLYDGIDAVYYLDKGMPRYDLIVAPGADIARVRMSVEGADGIRLLANGGIALRTSLGDVEMRELLSYQMNGKGERCQIASRFRVEGSTIAFTVGDYDRSRPLVVDPLIYSTLLGGASADYALALAVDAEGHAYVAGFTGKAADGEPDFPTTPGAYNRSFAGFNDIFVAKLNPTGTALIYATYIGGGGLDFGNAIAVDRDGNAYVTGRSQLPLQFDDFPTTDGAVSRVNRGEYDAFVTKLSADGSTLLYSTLLGGTGADVGTGIAVDRDGNAHVCGYTPNTGASDDNYPTTEGAYARAYTGGQSDAFLTKLNPTGTAMEFSTLIGGGEGDRALAVALDSMGHAYITGSTVPTVGNMTDYPATAGAYAESHAGGFNDAFVTKFNAAGTELIYSTLIGGSDDEIGASIAVDRDGAAHITGRTFGNASTPRPYPTTPGAYQTTLRGNYDTYITKLAPDGASLDFSTLIGGVSEDHGFGIAIDPEGSSYITGYTEPLSTAGTGFPVTDGPYGPFAPGPYDAFVVKMNATGRSLLYATLIGGAQYDYAWSIGVGADRNPIIAGHTDPAAAIYPTTDGAVSRTIVGTQADVFVTKVSIGISGVEAAERVRWLDLK